MDSPVIPTEHKKDLGVHIDDKLSYKVHINKISKKMKKKVGFFSENFLV